MPNNMSFNNGEILTFCHPLKLQNQDIEKESNEVSRDPSLGLAPMTKEGEEQLRKVVKRNQNSLARFRVSGGTFCSDFQFFKQSVFYPIFSFVDEFGKPKLLGDQKSETFKMRS